MPPTHPLSHPVHRTARVILTIAALLAVAACGGAGRAAEPTVDPSDAGAPARSAELADVLRAHGLASASSAIELVGLDMLIGDDEYTIFVPTDEAFQSLGADEIAELFADGERLAEVLRDHVVAGRTPMTELIDVAVITTEGGAQWPVDAGADTATVGGTAIVDADISVGSGGIVHVVDGLLGS